MEYLLFGSLGLLFYVYAGYPLVLALLTRARKASPPAGRSDAARPTVSLFIPAYNEARVIADKVRNSLALQYPPDALDIIVVSDGSTDGTVEIARAAGGSRIRAYQSAQRMGKSALINRFAAAECRGEVIVFTDANALFTPDAIERLVSHFADPTVGCVVGNLRYVDQFTAVAKGEGLYFKYESLLKRLESRLGTVVAATGSIYAIRRRFLEDFAPDVANDFAHPIRVAAAGLKVVFEPQAIALERATAKPEEEFRRKARIVTRGMTAFARYGRECRMLHGTWGLCFISHKLLRWFGWLYAAMALLANVALFNAGPAYTALLAAQVVFYGTALAGWFAGTRRGRLVAVPFYFCMINIAALSGAWRFLNGRRLAIWESAPTTR